MPGFDESRHAREAAVAGGLRSVTVTPTPEDVERHMTRIAWAMDEPAGGPGVIPQFVVAREAAAIGRGLPYVTRGLHREFERLEVVPLGALASW